MEIGTALSLSILQEDDDERDNHYSSKVVDIEENQYFIHYPIQDRTGKTSIFLEGTQLTAKYVGPDEVVYSFSTEVIGRKKINSIPVLVIRFPGKDQVMKIQRREFLRVQSILDVSVQRENQAFPSFTTTTIDISGGGMAMVSPSNAYLKENETVDVWIVLPFKSTDYHYIRANARVIRHILKEEGIYTTSLQFTTISNFDREKIVRYCFQKQLKKKKR